MNQKTPDTVTIPYALAAEIHTRLSRLPAGEVAAAFLALESHIRKALAEVSNSDGAP